MADTASAAQSLLSLLSGVEVRPCGGLSPEAIQDITWSARAFVDSLGEGQRRDLERRAAFVRTSCDALPWRGHPTLSDRALLTTEELRHVRDRRAPMPFHERGDVRRVVAIEGVDGQRFDHTETGIDPHVRDGLSDEQKSELERIVVAANDQHADGCFWLLSLCPDAGIEAAFGRMSLEADLRSADEKAWNRIREELRKAVEAIAPCVTTGREAVVIMEAQPAGASHSPDFRSVNWFGQAHSFTPKQAAIVKVLWDAWENRTPVLGEAYIVETAEIEGSRVAPIYRQHGAWKTMIVSAGKGMLRLQEP
ncbi:MAG: hypothetical protein KF774_10645 [Planctomyces sp.]|nr:hypothetical protein [Planctomyces sp.]